VWKGRYGEDAEEEDEKEKEKGKAGSQKGLMVMMLFHSNEIHLSRNEWIDFSAGARQISWIERPDLNMPESPVNGDV
jgi:hypothetical protein